MTTITSTTKTTKSVPRKVTPKAVVQQQVVKRQRPRRRRNRRAAQQSVQRPIVALSDCTVDYIRALIDPFSYSGELPCIPDMTIMPSNKIQIKIRGTLQTGAQGTGYVLLNPFSGVWNNNAFGATSYDHPVIYTTSDYDQANIVYSVAGGVLTTAGTAVANSNSPYVNNTLWTFRLVAGGLKVQYAGNDLYKQGTVHTFRTTSNNILTNTSTATIMQYNYTRRQPVSRAEEFVFYTPYNNTYTQYHLNSFLAPSVTGSQLNNLGIWITGGAIGNPQSWIFEAVCFYEVQGTGLPLSASHSDPSGFGSALSALPTVAPKGTPSQVLSAVLQGAAEALRENVSHMVSTTVMPRLTGVATAAGAAIVNRAMRAI